MSNKFPLKLMSILDTNEHSDIISWLPHGRGFIIRDKRRLADEVLPKYFKESKYTSFTRRLNRWNFTIQTHGHKEASYFHPMFIRGDPQRSLEMHPTPQSSNKARESRYIDDNQTVPVDAATSSGAKASSNNSVPMATMPAFDSGNGMMTTPYPSSVTSALARADVSAQVMAAGAAAACGEPYLDSRSNASMPALPQPQIALNVQALNPALSQVSMQPQYYGQTVSAMNPMYGTQAHQRTNLTRDMMFPRLPMDRSAIPREYQVQNGMVLLHPPQGTHAQVMHPHQMPYGEFPQYIPTTPASQARMQGRFVDPQIQHLRPMHPHIQFPNPNLAAGAQFSTMNSPPVSTQKTEQKAATSASLPVSKLDGKTEATSKVDEDLKPKTASEVDSKIINEKEGSVGKEEDMPTGSQSKISDASSAANKLDKTEATNNESASNSTKDKDSRDTKIMDASKEINDDSNKEDPTSKETETLEDESSAKEEALLKDEDTSEKNHPSPETEANSEPLAKKAKTAKESDLAPNEDGIKLLEDSSG